MTHQVYLGKPVDSNHVSHPREFVCPWDSLRNLPNLITCSTFKVAYNKRKLEITIDHSLYSRRIYSTKQGPIKGDNPDSCFQLVSWPLVYVTQLPAVSSWERSGDFSPVAVIPGSLFLHQFPPQPQANDELCGITLHDALYIPYDAVDTSLPGSLLLMLIPTLPIIKAPRGSLVFTLLHILVFLHTILMGFYDQSNTLHQVTSSSCVFIHEAIHHSS